VKILGFLIPFINRVRRGEGATNVEDLTCTEDPSSGTKGDPLEPLGTEGGTRIKDVPKACGTGAVVVVSWSPLGAEVSRAPMIALMGGHEAPGGFGSGELSWVVGVRWVPMIGCTGTYVPAGDTQESRPVVGRHDEEALGKLGTVHC
jgi:hypothetical protein